MQNTISSFYEKIDSLSGEEVSEYLSFFGEKILDHSEALNPKNVKAIASHIPFSFPYIKKIVENSELKTAYWDNEDFSKEQIEDIEISHVLLRHGLLNYQDLDSDLIKKIMGFNLDSDLVDLYFELLKTQPAERVINRLSDAESLLVQKYIKHVLETKEGVAALIEKESFIKLISEDKMIAHFVSLIEEEASESLDLTPLSEIQVREVIHQLTSTAKFSFAHKFFKGKIDLQSEIEENEDFTLMLCDLLPLEYLSDALTEN